MPLFVCSNCKCIENTALCHYWMHLGYGTPKLCSECDPEIGKWHGSFQKEEFNDKNWVYEQDSDFIREIE